MSSRNKDKGRLAPFMPLLLETMRSPAWRAMSTGARCLYMALKSRYGLDRRNNGRIFLSTRDAAEELGSNRNAVSRWFHELEHFGFTVRTAGGCLGVDGKGKAPRWRLTELGYMADAPTKDFLSWKGTPFRAPKKQNPGSESGATVAAKAVPVLVAKAVPPLQQSGSESGAISSSRSGSENGAISSLTTHISSEAA
jgi:hypothetical protein